MGSIPRVERYTYRRESVRMLERSDIDRQRQRVSKRKRDIVGDGRGGREKRAENEREGVCVHEKEVTVRDRETEVESE